MKKSKVQFPEKGIPPEEVLSQIKRRKSSDAEWKNGKMFGFVYHPDDNISRVIQEVHNLYFFENPINPTFFNSIIHFENETVSMVSDLLNGDKQVVGNVTSGGTESIFLAVKVARDRARKEHPEISKPEIIVPASAHPAFFKAAHFLDVSPVALQLRDDLRVDISLLPTTITKNTILIVGSAPSYPHGVVDPIEEMGRIAKENDILFHVDACLGGFMLPFAERLGYAIPVFDFRVEGVTSISADIHKYGYGAKGASIILYRNAGLRRKQFFVHASWPGGLFGSPTLLGTKSGGPSVAAWTVLKLLGQNGYLEVTKRTLEATRQIQKGINAINGLKVVSNPEMSVFAFTSEQNDIYRIGDCLGAKGWYLDRILSPNGLHLNVTWSNLNNIEAFLADLEISVVEIRKSKLKKVITSYSSKLTNTLFKTSPEKAIEVIASTMVKQTNKGKRSNTATFYGIAASHENRENIPALILDFLDKMYRKKN
ncbi:MAG: aspartate aminotransferase family protein [Bacteroidales bacterium]|nr:aspartate aminotransferase family protein [Bacteroidales bacterium]